MVELLAPAGSPEAVTAAVQSGANAVYLSFEDLTGCRRTENIPNSEFESVVRYCRIRGCRAYLALNIPVREDELNKAAGLALRAQRCGVDAIIVRDLGLFRILRSLLPEMPLFADAHLGFYTPESAAIAQRLGFRRVFLPPDLLLEDIRRMAQCPIETAVWVQTPLCAAACGTCRMRRRKAASAPTRPSRSGTAPCGGYPRAGDRGAGKRAGSRAAARWPRSPAYRSRDARRQKAAFPAEASGECGKGRDRGR